MPPIDANPAARSAPARRITRRREPRYAVVAEQLQGLIGSGQLRPGERAPSVRELSRQSRISAATAVAALRVLERRGVLEARPQSGFYVRPRPRRSAPLALTQPPRTASDVSVNSLLGLLDAARNDRRIVPLGSAIPESAWLPERALQRRVVAAARRLPSLLSEYELLRGLPALRHQIARRYAEIGCALAEDELLVTNGCMEALHLCIGAVASAGDTIAVESPAYFGFLQIIESLGLKALEIATDPRDGLSVEALQRALDGRQGHSIKACLLVSSYSNPLGASLPEPRRKALLEVCSEHDIALIEDDIYGELNYAGARPPPIKSLDRSGQVMLVSSFSKTLAPGARIGWVAPGKWLQAVRLRKFTTSASTAPLLQHALADWLAQDGYTRHLRRLRQDCAEHVELFSAAVERHFPPGTRISRPEGGFVLWVELPPGRDSLAMHARALREHISFLPGPLFSATGQYRNCLRLNCARSWTPRVAGAVRRLGQLAG